MKICVTGGSGFIGSWFFDTLRASGHQLSIIDLVAPQWDLQDARLFQGDIRDRDLMRRAAEGCDAVLHLAAAHHDFGISRDEFFSVNEHGAEVICAVMDELSIRNICFYSSVAVYGEVPEPISEQTTPRPVSDYGQSKLAGEKVLQRWVEAGAGRECLVIRPTVCFGPRNFANMYSLIRQIQSGRFLPIGDGKNIKSLAYVENIVDATSRLWGVTEPGSTRPVGEGFHVFNYVDKPDLTSAEICGTIYEALGKRAPGFRIPLPLAVTLGLPFDAVIALTGRNLPVSTARMKKLCTQTKFEADRVRDAGYTPRCDLREGIRRMVAWYRAEGHALTPATPASSQ